MRHKPVHRLIFSKKSRPFAFSTLFFTPLLLLLALGFSVQADSKTPKRFDMEQLVACQTLIEDIRWSNRIWPKGNKSPKPPRSEIITDGQIRAKVEKRLHMEAVLGELYGVDINEKLLQAEIDRMARSTRNPDRLQVLFDVLENNPVAIAECLARPALVQNKLYNSYASDNRQHGALRDKAEAILAGLTDLDTFSAPNVQKNRLTFVPRSDDSRLSLVADDPASHAQRIELDADEFARKVSRLVRDSITQTESNLDLHETETAFIYEKLLNQTEDSIEVYTLVWQKQGFDTWLASQPYKMDTKSPQPFSGELNLPIITGNGTGDTRGPKDVVIADAWAVYDQAPAGRILHTAVWTGSEMIVWGGYYYNFGANYLNTGSRYRPDTDSWSAITTKGAPGGRQEHTAIWTGSEMIVWGGFDGSSYLDTGGSYNPDTDTWSEINSGTLTGRSGHTAVWTDDEMIIWGGEDWAEVTNTGGSYDPATDTWTSMPDGVTAPSGRTYHTAVWTGSEMIVWGGG